MIFFSKFLRFLYTIKHQVLYFVLVVFANFRLLQVVSRGVTDRSLGWCEWGFSS